MTVKASIISACYNHGKYILEMLDSVLNQTFQDFEVIIVNDGSTDDTEKILNHIDHNKVKIFHTENHGPAHARNYAINHARGEIIMNLDADDKIAPSFLEKCIKILDAKPNVGIVYSDVDFFGARNGRFELEDFSIQNMLYENRIVANACFRKSDWELTSGFSSKLEYGLEDYDFWLSIIELGRDVFKIGEPLVFYRTYDDPRKSRSERRKSDLNKVYKGMIRIFRRHEDLYKRFPEIWGYFSTIENHYYLQLRSNKTELVNQESFKPTFSIITPTCKRPLLLKRAIKGVLEQSFTDFEHIIIDDANDSETAKIVSEFNSKKLRYFAHDKQRGAAAAYNTGMRLAKGKFINFLDDDDEYLPGILEKIEQTFSDAKDQIGFVWTGVTRVRDTDKGEETLVTQQWPAQFSTHKQGLTVSTAIGNGFGLSVRKECIDEIGYYDESLMIGEDTDFMIRLSERYNFRTVPEVLVKIHHHGETQLTHEKNFEIRWQCYKRIIERHFDFLSSYWAVFYIHCKAYLNLCYKLNKIKSGRKILWQLIKRFPTKLILYADFICYELFKLDYKMWKAKR